jgi:hypothetical protein
MTESVKTLIYTGAALLLFAGAVWVSLPPSDTSGETEAQILYPDFQDSKEAARLEIVRVDEKRGKLDRFEVERTPTKGWVIPSHGGYPADATAQMSEAATSLINLNVVAVVSEDASKQELYGVVEPTEARLDAGDKGFGMLVAFQDRKGDDLARLVVGKKVADSDTQRFVRKAGQDAVYVVDLNVDKLTTNFGDWIEKDLLKISPWDIDRVMIKDYQFIARAGRGGFELDFDPRMELTAGIDGDANGWVVDKLIQYARKRPVETELKADEELNKEKLDDLKSALDNLQIVDVKPKPEGLAGDLSADDAAFKNPDLLQSLQSLGFVPHEEGRRKEFLGFNGELNVGTKDGVEYVLRFGSTESAEAGENKAGEAKARRYLFVTARLDNSRLKPPTLDPLPTESTVPVAPEKKDDDAQEPKEPGSPGQDVVGDAPSDEAKSDDAKADETKTDETKADEAKPATNDFDLKRKQIEKENQRKQDEFKERKRKAEGKVRELNARFAGWYYVISDDEFQKIHLTRNDVIKERSGPGAEGTGVDAYHELKQQGVNKPKPVPMPPAGGPPGLPPGFGLDQ